MKVICDPISTLRTWRERTSKKMSETQCHMAHIDLTLAGDYDHASYAATLARRAAVKADLLGVGQNGFDLVYRFSGPSLNVISLLLKITPCPVHFTELVNRIVN